MYCLVTGAAGFIGINLCKKLIEYGYNVIGIDNCINNSPDELLETCDNENFCFYKFDFAINKKTSIFKNIDIIYHLGGMSGVRESILHPNTWFENNVIGTFNILENARRYKTKKVVIISSSASVGNAKLPIHEELPLKPISPYGASKGFKELYASAYYHSYNIDTAILRLSNVYGPHSIIKTSLVAKFIKKIMNNEELSIYGTGKQTRDFIYVDDVVNAIIAASQYRTKGEVFQVSTQRRTSVNTMTKNICKEIRKYGFKIPKINYIEAVKGDIMSSYASNKKTRHVLKWKPYTNIKQGLKKTIRWFVKRGQK